MYESLVWFAQIIQKPAAEIWTIINARYNFWLVKCYCLTLNIYSCFLIYWQETHQFLMITFQRSWYIIPLLQIMEVSPSRDMRLSLPNGWRKLWGDWRTQHAHTPTARKFQEWVSPVFVSECCSCHSPRVAENTCHICRHISHYSCKEGPIMGLLVMHVLPLVVSSNSNLIQEPSFPHQSCKPCKMWSVGSLFTGMLVWLLSLHHFLQEGCCLSVSNHLMIWFSLP